MKNELVMNLTEGMYDAQGLVEELTIVRDLMTRYFLSCDDEGLDKKECWCHFENLTQLTELIKN